MMTLKEIKPTDPDYYKPIEKLIDDLGHAEPANQHGDVIISIEDLTDTLHYLQTYHRIEDEYEELKDWWAEEYVENVALSWDELKQMEGKPVWVEKKHSKLYHMWGLVARIKRHQGHEYAVIKCPDLCNSPMSNIRLYDTMYLNDGWQAYRKEQTDAEV